MKKLLSAVFLLSLMVSFASVTPNVKAITVIPEGAIIKTATNPDVYIVKYKNGKQFKRLVLNPQVFESYGHLRWEDILTISQSEINSFATSNLVRVDGQTDIYRLAPNGDIGNKHLLISTDGYDLDSAYTINRVDFGNYVAGEVEGVTVEQQSEESKRLTKAIQFLDQLIDLTAKAKSELDVLNTQIEAKQSEMDSTTILEYNSLIDQYNIKLEHYKKILSMQFVIDDYKNNIYITVEDRTFLGSLGIFLN